MPQYQTLIPSFYQPPAGGGDTKNKRWLSQSTTGNGTVSYVDPNTRALFEPFDHWYNWGARPEDLGDPRFVPMAFSCVFPKCVQPGRALYLVGNELEDPNQGRTSPQVAAARWKTLLVSYDINTLIFGGWLNGADWLRSFLAECACLNIALPVKWHAHGYTYKAGDTYQAETPGRVIARWEELFGMVSGPFVISEYGDIDGNLDNFRALDDYARSSDRIIGRCPFTVTVTGYEKKWYPKNWPKPAHLALQENGALTAVGIEYCKAG